LLIQVARAPVTVTEAPFGSGWLKSVNLSPGTRLFGPRLCTFIVPPATLLINEPETLTMSFDGESVLLISIVNVEALLVKWLLVVSVPTEAPGERVPVSSVAGPENVPAPPSPPAVTWVELATLAPLTIKVPLTTPFEPV